MSREEKRQIRLEITELLNKCQGCKYQYSKGETPAYCSTVCPVGITMQTLSQKLIQDEKRKISVEPVFEKPLVVGEWSPEEEFYLLNHINLFQVNHLSIRLNRAPKSVSAKISYLKRKYPESIKKRWARR